ncbi:type I-E CRISPR-associated protein Cas7/Cse4/CasC [Saccharopolyspora elongata]|uniref:Type I-E CRISPR-associated protein Cas7/Cse4/CasC n=1 Tax=Saccharopolyspora elongata TaxID=2530387 RepID=A0A4R4YUL6_9PSEU|nr:type I-E CRISPR-associated protein Cas7/Cse4/CasC [Saccharopolyspora elongata]TDD49003.1 type I-E CRISPR-associated protein Cas7/Cse4/CasC [Saccharopolyspora elongata]
MTQRRYIDVHILQTVPPANLNRDDQGNPKEAYFGGVRRSRVSSQAWKRATRLAFAERGIDELDLGTRTKKIAAELTNLLLDRTALEEEAAARLAGALLGTLEIKAGKKAGDTAYLLFYGHRQLEEVAKLVADRAEELAALDDAELAAAVKDLPVKDAFGTGHPVDVALFGRMVADIATLKVDAATQVAHAVSTHATELEFDYYTAVDDQNPEGETGAGMIGTIGFNSATLYRFATIGLHQLQDNLGGDHETALQAVELFVSSFARSMPSGYTNSFAHRTLPHLVAVVVRDDQPVNLVSAFENPVTTGNGSRAAGGIATTSARRLAREQTTATSTWGDTPAFTGLCCTLDADDETTTSALTDAFGQPRSFPQLVADLRTHLAERGENN